MRHPLGRELYSVLTKHPVQPHQGGNAHANYKTTETQFPKVIQLVSADLWIIFDAFLLSKAFWRRLVPL